MTVDAGNTTWGFSPVFDFSMALPPAYNSNVDIRKADSNKLTELIKAQILLQCPQLLNNLQLLYEISKINLDCSASLNDVVAAVAVSSLPLE